MRILLISNYFPPFEIGGWEQLAHDVSLRLRERSHVVHILTSSYRRSELTEPEPGISRKLHLESPNHIYYHPWYSLSQPHHEAENQSIVRQTIADFSPDIVFVNGMWNMSSGVARAAEQHCPGRVVYYMASYWPTEIDAHTAYWIDRPARFWLRWPKKMVGQLIQKRWLSADLRHQLDFQLVLCVSDFMRQRIIERTAIPRERTAVVYNGIDLNNFPFRSPSPSWPILRLLYAGRLTPDKGVHTVIEALSHFQEKQPDKLVNLSIVGAGSPAYEGYLRQLAHDKNVAGWVHFGRQVPRERMAEVLAVHDVLLFPSIWPEPLARMVQEAMACGLVVIGTATGGTPEILVDGQNGLTFPPEDGRVLAEKIASIANDPDLLQRLVQSARQTVAARFTLDQMVDELEYYFTQIRDRAVIQKG